MVRITVTVLFLVLVNMVFSQSRKEQIIQYIHQVPTNYELRVTVMVPTGLGIGLQARMDSSNNNLLILFPGGTGFSTIQFYNLTTLNPTVKVRVKGNVELSGSFFHNGKYFFRTKENYKVFDTESRKVKLCKNSKVPGGIREISPATESGLYLNPDLSKLVYEDYMIFSDGKVVKIYFKED